MARIALTSPELEVEHRPTCRQPTEAWAYQVPRVPCLAKISVSRRCTRPDPPAARRSPRRRRPAFPSLLHRHHDVEAGLAHVPDRRLEGRILDRPAHGRRGKPRSPISSFRAVQPAQVLRLVVLAGELDQQQRIGFALTKRSTVGRNIGMSRASVDHRPVDQLDRGRVPARRYAGLASMAS